jgi:hypothetical protein
LPDVKLFPPKVIIGYGDLYPIFREQLGSQDKMTEELVDGEGRIFIILIESIVIIESGVVIPDIELLQVMRR